MEIRIANIDDIIKINKLFHEVINDLNDNKNINMLWGDEYPFCEFRNDIENKRLYLLEKNNKLIGSFSLSDTDNGEYENINWKNKNGSFLYINRLVVAPKEQGKGFAKLMLDYIQKYAHIHNIETLRLTVCENNIYAINIYEKFGFKKIEKGF